jgi:hypothetical protein
VDEDLSRAAPLVREARFLHQRFFRREASSTLIAAYCRAHRELAELRAFDAVELTTVNRIVDRKLSAVAIEPWLRRSGRRHALSAKLLLVAYLAESDTAHAEFSRDAPPARCALCRFVGTCVVAGLQLLWGRLQRARHGLV